MASEYVFKLKQTFSSSKRGCDCSDSQVNEESICKPQMLLPGGWGAVEDDGGCLFYFNFSQYPHRVQYEPPKLEEDGGGLAWREILSLSEATKMAGGRPLSPMLMVGEMMVAEEDLRVVEVVADLLSTQVLLLLRQSRAVLAHLSGLLTLTYSIFTNNSH